MPSQTEILSLIRLLRPHKSSIRKVRIGSCGDGGYVLPDDLDDISALVSLGVGGNVDFDYYFANRGIPVFQYDPTVEGPPLTSDNFHFHKIAWGPETNASSSTLNDILVRHELSSSNNLILKFDTEGAEWDSLETSGSDPYKNFRIIVCELHSVHSIQNPVFAQRFGQIMGSLTQHHTVVHLHGNNCCGFSLIEGVPVPKVVEITLLRNDRGEFSPTTEQIPGPLDFPSMSDRPDLALTPFI